MKSNLLLALFFVTQLCSAQISFQKYYGNDSLHHYIRKIIQTSDGGYALIGILQQITPVLMSPEMLIIRLDQSGDTLWTRTLGDSLEDQLMDILQTPDGGFVLAGQTTSFTPGWDQIVLIKMDSTGNLLWSKHYGGVGTDICRKILLTENNGFQLIGNTTSFGTGGL